MGRPNNHEEEQSGPKLPSHFMHAGTGSPLTLEDIANRPSLFPPYHEMFRKISGRLKVDHRIPVELLCSLSQRGEPGQGLSLCIARQKVVRGKIRDSVGTTSSEDESDPDDGIVKVLSDKRWHGTPLIGLAVKYRPRIQLLLTKDWSLK